MRFVDISSIEMDLGKNWRTRAAMALEEVRTARGDERAAVLLRRANLWAEAGAKLARLSARRCWYCEARELRSDMPVDHFRPKSRVAEEREEILDASTGRKMMHYSHDGYWWLAFTASNYRRACTFCNSRRIDEDGGTEGGKHDHFPLEPGSVRARAEHDALGAETPTLLDPCVASDPELLTFLQDGMPRPRRQESENPTAYRRADVSIRLYHLDHAELVWARAQLWDKVEKLVKRGSRYLAEGGEGGTRALDDVKADLHALIRRTTPLSRVAHLAVRSRRDVGWVREWLEDVETTL